MERDFRWDGPDLIARRLNDDGGELSFFFGALADAYEKIASDARLAGRPELVRALEDLAHSYSMALPIFSRAHRIAADGDVGSLIGSLTLSEIGLVKVFAGARARFLCRFLRGDERSRAHSRR
jgi:hypothetical protein